MEPLRFRNRKFTMQVPGEAILFVLVKVTVLIALGLHLL